MQTTRIAVKPFKRDLIAEKLRLVVEHETTASLQINVYGYIKKTVYVQVNKKTVTSYSAPTVATSPQK